MNVYVVLNTVIDGYINGVFSTEEKARAYVTANPDWRVSAGDTGYEPFDRIESYEIDVVVHG